MTNVPQTADRRALLQQALRALEEMQAKLEQVERGRNAPVAIIGMGCRFPGGADTPEAFWQLLRDGVDTVTEIPPGRWASEQFYDPDPDAPGKMYVRHGAFLSEPVDQFDAGFFGIAPREAVSMDPQQRLLLEVTWEALEHAALSPQRLAGSRTGVFVGMSTHDYAHLLTRTNGYAGIDLYYGSGIAHSIAAGRLSYILGLHGPSIAVDTACSSSLVAIHLAIQSLRARESDTALAGGVSLVLTPDGGIATSRGRMVAPDGRCKTFDASADGYVRGEGCGIVVLKRLEDALNDGNQVLAVIRGSAVNQDGRSNGLTAPNGRAQEQVISAALANAGVAPHEIGYIEAHGTGTSLGDPIEIRALGASLGDGRSAGRPLMVGSVKTNIGHLEAGAGVAGLIKTVLALRHKTIPPHLHFNQPNPYIPWRDIPISVPTVALPWHAEGRRIAGVSSFGFSGTNAHLIVEEAPELKPEPESTPERPAHILTLSAQSAPALAALVARYRAYIADHPQTSLADLCYTANVGRSHLPYRSAIVADSLARLDERLVDSGAEIAGRWQGHVKGGNEATVALLFTGQGAQYPGMARQLYATQPVFRAALDQCADLLAPHLDRPLLEVLFDTDTSAADHPLHQTGFTQPALFSVEYALAQLWLAWGLTPGALLGHSLGEYVAAVLAGVFSLEDGLRLVAARGRLMQQLPAGGSMAAIFAAVDQVQHALASVSRQLSVAAVNGPEHTVVAGPAEAVAAVSARFTAAGVRVQPLVVSHAFHSPLMAPMLAAFAAVAATVRYRSPQIPLIANVSGRLAGPEVATPAYWVEHIQMPVQFAAGMATLVGMGCDTFVEVGPHPVLTAMAQACVPESSAAWLPSLRRGRDDWAQMLESLAALYVRGVAVDWAAFDRPYARRPLILPTYPFQRRRFWVEPLRGTASSMRIAAPVDGHPLVGRPLRSPLLKEIMFEAQLGAYTPAFLDDHRLNGTAIFPASGYLEMALAAARLLGSQGAAIARLDIQEALVLPEEGTRRVQLLLTPETATSASFQIVSIADDTPGAGWAASTGAWQHHAHGVLRLDSLEAPALWAIEDLAARCVTAEDPEAYYDKLHQLGMAYGPTFRGLIKLELGAGEALAQIRVAPELGDIDSYQFHPAILDACFQAIGAALLSVPESDQAGSTFLPVGVENLRVFGPPTRELWCHAQLLPAPEGADALVASLRVVSSDRRTVAMLDRLTLRRVRRGAFQRQTAAGIGDWLYRPGWQPQPLPEPTGQASGTWLILAADQDTGARLARQLEARGAQCVIAWAGDCTQALEPTRWQVDLSDPNGVADLLAASSPDGVIHLVSVDRDEPASLAAQRQLQAELLGSTLQLMQSLAARPGTQPRLWLVTRGGQSVEGESPAMIPALWGLGRVIGAEHPALRCTCVDLDPNGDAALDELAGEVLAGSAEDQVAYRDGRRFVARLERFAPAPPLVPAGQPYRLELPARGALDQLRYAPLTRRAPGPGEVEVEVHASGLNFRDVLNVLGMYPGDPGRPGLECAGIVTAVGPDVTTPRVGERVVALGIGSFDSHLVTPASLAFRLPDTLTFAEAVTIPSAFLTAAYGLLHLARLQPGERVLIHAAAGGVGLAAVQLALRAGAEIFATAGSAHKQALLRGMGVPHVFSSRTLAFADAIPQLTGGQGVDVVLNSLADEFIPRSVDLLAPNGRFIEIGKRGLLTAEQFAARRPAGSYFPFELGSVLVGQPGLLEGLLRELLDACAAGELHPLPLRAFPARDLVTAFRYMAQARHVGKVVITHQPAAGALRPDGRYLITGGLGGLGLVVAQDLVARGARFLTLVGRRAPGEQAEAILAALRAEGADVQVLAADISEPAGVDEVLAAIAAAGVPLRGVFHAAGVLDDGVLTQQDWTRFARVLAPKADAAWLLDRATRPLALDYFVLFSSAAALLGAPGQGNYAAANAALDGLAAARRAAGLPGLSINWGGWSEVGMAAALAARDQQRAAAQGVGMIAPAQGAAALAALLDQDAAQIAVLPIDWQRLRQHAPAVAGRPLFEQLVHESAAPTASEQAQWAQDVLTAATSEGRSIAMRAYLVDRLARVLGSAPEHLDPQQSILALGLDSLMAVELRNRVTRDLNLSVPATVILRGPSIEDLAETLAAMLGTNQPGEQPDTDEPAALVGATEYEEGDL